VRLTEWIWKLIPKTRWCISKWAICDFQGGDGWRARKSDNRSPNSVILCHSSIVMCHGWCVVSPSVWHSVLLNQCSVKWIVSIICVISTATWPQHDIISFYGWRAFCVAGPLVWNSMPDSLRYPIIGRNSFRQSLKLFLFATYWCIQRIRGFTTMRYINRLFYLLTYLLTYNDVTTEFYPQRREACRTITFLLCQLYTYLY